MLDEAMEIIRESFECGQSVTFSPRGTSMLPLLKEGRDTVTLSPPPRKLKKYDIILYKRSNGQYVLHRIIRVGETYSCIGDNQFVTEHNITTDQIFAVCSSFTRNGRQIFACNLQWRLYAIIWHYSRPLRRIYLGLRKLISKIIRK